MEHHRGKPRDDHPRASRRQVYAPRHPRDRPYDLAGPETLTFDAMLRAFRARTPGAKRLPILGVPSRPAAAVARVHGAVGLGRLLPFDEGMALMASEDSVGDAAPARADLGFDPQAFTESLASYAARL